MNYSLHGLGFGCEQHVDGGYYHSSSICFNFDTLYVFEKVVNSF